VYREAILAVVVRPRLWPVAALEMGRLARPGWWRRWPPLPWPDPEYLAFRMVTAYGDAGATPDAADLVAYLEWCRGMNALKSGRGARGRQSH
jgi:hypothetical protein